MEAVVIAPRRRALPPMQRGHRATLRSSGRSENIFTILVAFVAWFAVSLVYRRSVFWLRLGCRACLVLWGRPLESSSVGATMSTPMSTPMHRCRRP